MDQFVTCWKQDHKTDTYKAWEEEGVFTLLLGFYSVALEPQDIFFKLSDFSPILIDNISKSKF